MERLSDEALNDWIKHLTRTANLEGLSGLDGNRQLLRMATELKERREAEEKKDWTDEPVAPVPPGGIPDLS